MNLLSTFVIVFGFIKLLHLLRFNDEIGILISTITSTFTDTKVYTFLFVMILFNLMVSMIYLGLSVRFGDEKDPEYLSFNDIFKVFYPVLRSALGDF
jgi:hypothetical protein